MQDDKFKFNIPDIGDCFQLVEDWEFPLHLEGRNHTLINRVKPGMEYGYGESDNTLLVTLEAGTVLGVDRIYVRKGKSEWSSITFFVKHAPGDTSREKVGVRTSRWDRYYHKSRKESQPEERPEEKRKGARFWAKLDAVNEMHVKRISKDEIPVEQKKRPRKSTTT